MINIYKIQRNYCVKLPIQYLKVLGWLISSNNSQQQNNDSIKVIGEEEVKNSEE